MASTTPELLVVGSSTSPLDVEVAEGLLPGDADECPRVLYTQEWYGHVKRRAWPHPSATAAPRWRQTFRNVRSTPSSPRTTRIGRSAISSVS